MIYVQWCAADTPFSQTWQGSDVQQDRLGLQGPRFGARRRAVRNDVDVARMTLSHQEGRPAEMELRVLNPRPDPESEPADNPDRPRWIVVGYWAPDANRPVCLFRGRRVQNVPDHPQAGVPCAVWTFSGDHPDFQERWQPLAGQIKAWGSPFYEPLLVGERDTPQDLLASRPFCLFWDRCTAELGLSHALQGRAHHDLSAQETAGMQITTSYDQPLTHVEVQAAAQWVQTRTGYKDFGPAIARQFQGGQIASYTGKSLKDSWMRLAQGAKLKGYRVISAHLYEAPGYEGDATPAPDHLLPLPDIGGADAKIPGVQPGKGVIMQSRQWVRKTVFDGSLWVAYDYRQKYKETVHFVLAAHLCPAHTFPERRENLTMPLPKLVDHEDVPLWTPFQAFDKDQHVQYEGCVYRALGRCSASAQFRHADWEQDVQASQALALTQSHTFFGTGRGYHMVEHLLARAVTKMTWGTRTLKVQVRGRLDQLGDIQICDSVSLCDVRLPKGKATGKVVSWECDVRGYQPSPDVRMTVACAVTAPIDAVVADEHALPAQEQLLYAHEYAASEYCVQSNAWVRSAAGPWYQRYDDVIALPPVLPPVAIRVFQDAQAQEQALMALGPRALLLQDRATRIELEFPPLHSSETCQTRIEMRLKDLWTYTPETQPFVSAPPP